MSLTMRRTTDQVNGARGQSRDPKMTGSLPVADTFIRSALGQHQR
jgi:hypothetical protein